MGGPQVASHEADVAVDGVFKDDLAVSSAQLTAHRQLCWPAHGGHLASSFASGRVLLHSCFQNQQVRYLAGVTVTVAKHLLKSLRLAQLVQKGLVDGDLERRLEIYFAGVDLVHLHAPGSDAGILTDGRGIRCCSLGRQVKWMRKGDRRGYHRKHEQ